MPVSPSALWRTVCLVSLLLGTSALAATDVNHAREADLDGIKGIGPALSARILAERSRRQFRDWSDLIARVKGINAAAAARLSGEGLTVNGASYAPPAQQPSPLDTPTASGEETPP